MATPHLYYRYNSKSSNKNINSSGNSTEVDRFIPKSVSRNAYKSIPMLNGFDISYSELCEKSPSPERLSSPEFFNELRNTGHYESISTTNEFSMSSISSSSESQVTRSRSARASRNDYSKLTKEQKDHRKNIAHSLGFQLPDRVFTFETTSAEILEKNKAIKNCFGPGSCAEIRSTFDFSTLSPDVARYYIANSNARSASPQRQIQRPAKRVKSHIPYRVLDAPCLRNDFYSNLISWSRTTNNVLVGLGCSVYIWSEKEGAVSILDHQYLSEKRDLVTCVSFCPYNTYFIVGTKFGRILLYDQKEFFHSNNTNKKEPVFVFQTESFKGICCLEWFKPGEICKFYVGEENGNVSLFEIKSLHFPIKNWSKRQKLEDENLIGLKLHSTYQAQAQQVCGISLNEHANLLAVGGNDNSCSLWDISDLDKPIKKFVLPHKAAVKAIAFCPWSKSLLATGGGSKDRCIKFWHTSTGTLLDEIYTSGQVTSLIWSLRHKQIVATFGFGDTKNPVLITLYSYPKLSKLLEVRSPNPLRVLSAVISPSSMAICVATNDETIRFYELWNDKEEIINEIQESGIYGSNIIEYMEGIETTHNKRIR
ncbi:Ama1p [Saccharomyces cerevisiae YJM1388]|nr:Ama1p [Saccharomyces cerevisiae YJM1388]